MAKMVVALTMDITTGRTNYLALIDLIKNSYLPIKGISRWSINDLGVSITENGGVGVTEIGQRYSSRAISGRSVESVR